MLDILEKKEIKNYNEELDKLYISFDKKFNLRTEKKFASLVNFSKHKDLPFQRWHYYQEGYSPDLVIEIFNYLNLDSKKSTILDPFVGSGSTMVAAQKKGVKSIGIELNPFSYFMADAKTRNYNFTTLNICEKFKLPEYRKINNVYDHFELSIIEKLYSKESLSKIELIRKSIELIKDMDAQIILKATLFSLLESCSNYKKGGNGLKKRKKANQLDIYVEFENKLLNILQDIKSKKTSVKVEIFNTNVRELDKLVPDDSIDLSIFSPPYANF